MTNEDRICESTEILAEFIEKITGVCDYCVCQSFCTGYPVENCKANIKKWLKSEAESGSKKITNKEKILSMESTDEMVDYYFENFVVGFADFTDDMKIQFKMRFANWLESEAK